MEIKYLCYAQNGLSLLILERGSENFQTKKINGRFIIHLLILSTFSLLNTKHNHECIKYTVICNIAIKENTTHSKNTLYMHSNKTKYHRSTNSMKYCIT